jgi:predicted O-linked N-acetylglucosamine transferase (SPINDLY family)
MNVADANFQAAVQAFNAKNWVETERLCRQATAEDSRHAPALNLLGLALSEMGRVDDAIGALREAVAIRPTDPYLWSNLGDVYCSAGKLSHAVECQRQALAVNPNLPEAHYNLSVAYRGLGQIEQAIAAARRATELRPEYAKAQYNLGFLLDEDGRPEEALAAYHAALTLRPNWADAHLGMAISLHDLRRFENALWHFQQVLRLQPGRKHVERAIGRVLQNLGQVAEANAAFERAEADAGEASPASHALSLLFRESLAEVIAPDRAYIEAYLARVHAALQRFTVSRPAAIDLSVLDFDPPTPSGILAYYGDDVRPIVEKYAKALATLVPSFSPRPRQGKLRLGIVVSAGDVAVFARCWGGICERLSRELFDLRIICSRSGASTLRRTLKVSEQEYLVHPEAIAHAARFLYEQEFDWLHYWEIGTTPMNYYLPFFRAASGQSGCWGWPITSGNSYVDSYLSCEQIEPPDGAAHYTEQLVQLRRLPTYYHRPAVPANPSRIRFGLDDAQRVYLCTQSLRKYHPDFDSLLAELLRSDSQGLLLIVGDRRPSVTELLLNRFGRTMPDILSRVRVLPWMETAEYLELVAVADVVLDTLHYGGGANTVYDTVAVGTPLVTLPGEFHRSRWATAVNRRLGLERLIAGTPQEYVSKAVEVAGNADLRHDLRRQILAAGAELFEDAAVVREHAEYFSQAIAAKRAEKS